MIHEGLVGQLDYILLCHGFALVFLTGVCLNYSRKNESLPWRCLALFGIIHAVGEWLELLALSLPDSSVLRLIRIMVMAISYLFLIEFARQGWQREGRWTPGWWIYVVFLGLAGTGISAGISGLTVTCQLALGVPGGLLAGGVILGFASKTEPIERRPLYLTGLAFLAYGLAEGLNVPKGSFFPSSVINQEFFRAAAGFPIQMAQILCVAFSAAGIYLVYYNRLQKENPNRYRRKLVAVTIAVLLICGWWISDWSGKTADDTMRNTILSLVIKISETVDPQQVKSLSFTAEDKIKPQFQRLRRQLIAFGQVIHQRSIYTMALRDGKIKFGPENIDEKDSMASPPGTVYQQPSPGSWEILRTGHPLTEGPCTDEYGTFISAFSPVRDPRTGQVLLAVGLDILADNWKAQVSLHRLVPILFTMALVLTLVFSAIVIDWYEQKPSLHRFWFSYTDVASTAAFGLILTAGVAILVYHEKTDSRRLDFAQIAEARAAGIVGMMRDLRDSRLENLGRFLDCNPEVDRNQFHVFSGSLRTSSIVQALEWIPRITPDAVPQIEEKAYRDGRKDFSLWQKDSQGNRMPVTKREVYYPVYYVEPLADNEQVLGYDLGSDPVCRAALEEVQRTGLPTATNPISLTHANGSQKGLLVYRPVFLPNNPSRPRGFALAVLRLETMLKQAFGQQNPEQSAVVVDLFHLRAHEPPIFLASSLPQNVNSHEAMTLSKSNDLRIDVPLFAFGKAFAVVVHPGSAFPVNHPTRAGWMAFLVGMLLTSAITVFVGTLAYRRTVLQREMEMSTKALAAMQKAKDAIHWEDVRTKAILKLSQMTHLTIEKITEYSLETGIRLTGSRVGFIAFVEADETIPQKAHGLEIIAQGQDTDKNIFVLEDPNLWAQAMRQRRTVINNDSFNSVLPLYPVSLARYMIVPIFDGGRIVALVGAGNKETDYAEEDANQLMLMMDGLWKVFCRKQAEQALWQSEKTLQSTFTAVPVGVVLVHDRVIQKINNRLSEITGYTPAELIGQQSRMLYPDDTEYERAGREVYPNVLQYGEGTTEAKWQRKEGKIINVLINVAALEPANPLAGQVVTVLDFTRRKVAEESLRQSEATLRSAFAAVPFGMAVVRNRIIQKINDRLSEITGYTTEEAIGKSSRFFYVNEAEFERAGRELYQDLYQKGEGSTESQFRHKNGRLVDVLITAIPLDMTNASAGQVVTILDITDRKRGEAERALDAQRMESLLALNRMSDQPIADIMAFAVEETIRLTDSKIGYLATLNEDETILTMQYWSKAAHASCAVVDRPIIYPLEKTGLWGEAVRERKPVITNDYSASNLKKRGTPEGHVPITRHMNIPVFDRGRIVAVAGVGNKSCDYNEVDVRQLQLLMDGWWHIVTRTRTSEELHRAHIKTRRILESMPSALISVDSEGRVVEWNQAAEQVLGIPALDVWGRRFDELEFGWDRVTIDRAISECRSTRQLVRVDDVRFKRPDGTDSFLGIIVTPIKMTDETDKAFLLMAADITDRKALQCQLAQAQRLEAVGQLAAGIAHEINTPTQFVSDNTRFLQTAFPKLQNLLTRYHQLLDLSRTGPVASELVTDLEATIAEVEPDYLLEEIPEAIKDSLEGLERVTKIVLAMKDFSHPGQQEMCMADLNKAIESTVTVARNEWKYVAEMVLDLDPSLPNVPCMLGDFNQVILNIIVNAAYAIADVAKNGGPSMGTITVTTRNIHGYVEIRVRDTGTGIPEEYRDKIFDHFFTTKEVGKGTGQGLTISRQVIVEKHGGTLTFETETGKGTTFIIRLPLEQKNGAGKEKSTYEDACSTN